MGERDTLFRGSNQDFEIDHDVYYLLIEIGSD